MKKFVMFAILLMASIFASISMTTSKAYALEDCCSTTTNQDGSINIVGVKNDALQNGVLTIPSTYNGQKVVSLGRPLSQLTDSNYVLLQKANITTLNLKEATNLKTIDGQTFKGCNTLTGEIVLPASLQSIGKASFSGTNITKVVVTRYDGLNYTEIDTNSFGVNPNLEICFESDEAKAFYQNLESWSAYKENMAVKPKEVVVDIEFEIDGQNVYSIERVLNKSFKFVKNNNIWEENKDYKFETPSKQFYTFLGWSIDGQTIVDEDYVITQDDTNNGKIVLQALWQANKHTITYHYDSTIYSNQSLAEEFYEKDGYTLPDLVPISIDNIWGGWFTDNTHSTKVYKIPVGTTTDVEVWGYNKKFQPYVTLSHSLVDGESKNNYLYGEKIKLNALITPDLDDKYTVRYDWEILDKEWKTLNSVFLENLLPNTYSVKCTVRISWNNQTKTLIEKTEINVIKHVVDIEWDEQETFIYSNDIITPSYTLSSDTITTDVCEFTTKKYVGSDWVDAESKNIGTYKIVVSIKDEYKNIVSIYGVEYKNYIIEPRKVNIGYELSSMNIEYGETYTPNIVFEDCGYGFSLNYVNEKVSIKYSTGLLSDYSTRTLDQDIETVKPVEDVGNYVYVLSMLNQNYQLNSTYVKFNLRIDQQVLNVKWNNVNFVYDGKSHKPTASATTKSREVVGFEVLGEKINANSTECPTYTATAVLTDQQNYLLDCPEIQFYIEKAQANIECNYNNLKFYDGEAVEITAWVTDANGVVSGNVAIVHATDLTSVGTHNVRLVWGGDTNHYAVERTINITIKTENILYGNDETPEIAVECPEGFDTLNDVVIRKGRLETINLSRDSYNNINALYTVSSIYTLSSDTYSSVSLNILIPSDVKDIKNLKVLKTNNDGTTEEVGYTIIGGRIKVLSSDANATYILVLEKSQTKLVLYIALSVGLVCGTLLAVCLLTIKRRKLKSLEQ